MKRFILCLFVTLIAGCYSAPPEARQLMDRSIAATAGHASDPHDELSPLAEAAFLADHDAWQKVRYLVFGVKVDADVARRQAEREGASGEDTGGGQ